MTDEVSTPPPKIDAQDPLPETDWFWRRIYVFFVTTGIYVGAWFMAQAIVSIEDNGADKIAALRDFVKWLCILGWFSITYYLIAPSAEHITRWVQTAGMLKRGITTSSVQTATGADGSVAQSTTVTGPAPVVAAVVPAAVEAPSVSGLPANSGTAYAGPDTAGVEPVAPTTPKDAPWPK